MLILILRRSTQLPPAAGATVVPPDKWCTAVGAPPAFPRLLDETWLCPALARLDSINDTYTTGTDAYKIDLRREGL
ncbi:hypothetical protein Y1Q_0011744 [Alligator mississippiensis]|uniref:Uncharacterized protein n=1 Tax=Alligator mississippiensis TaxID=8496 RepID=A0A151M0Z4_ALLMI|nr:hypothetical protein Y1Q_0011744 [Alligator mississippiensis]